MRYFKKIFVFLAAIFVSAFCLNLVAAQTPVYSDATKKIIATHAAPEFIIKLKANPTTGYTWSTQSYDKQLLTLESFEYIPPNGKLIGASGASVWKFKVNPLALSRSFSTQIELIYARTWNLSDNPSHVVFSVFYH